MNRKRYSSPMVYVFDVRAAQTLLSGTTVIPGEQHDPSGAGTRRRNVWDDTDEEI